MEDSIQSDSRRGRNGDGNGEAERLSLLSFLRALKSGGDRGLPSSGEFPRLVMKVQFATRYPKQTNRRKSRLRELEISLAKRGSKESGEKIGQEGEYEISRVKEVAIRSDGEEPSRLKTTCRG